MVHSRKLAAEARKAIRAMMTPEQMEAEGRAKLAILNDFRARHGLSILTIEEANGKAVA
jgi:hypothetical protein